MKNFCLYAGKKIVKQETWNITSIELSSDYASVIIQAESKFSTSEHTLDITHLVADQYKNGIDPYSATVVNSLIGAVDWVLDLANNRVVYYESNRPDTAQPYDEYFYHNGWDGVRYSSPRPTCQALFSIL